MKATGLTTEYLVNPIGIGTLKPRLSWTDEGGKMQTAYRIYAESEDGVVLWDTGRVESPRMTLIEWAGLSLRSRSAVRWKVKLWDENGEEGEWSETASFEMGLLEPSDWRARWITGNYEPDTKSFDRKKRAGDIYLLQAYRYVMDLVESKKQTRYPADCFRRDFTVKSKVIKARLYITACGIYEAKINGEKAGDSVLAPGITDYRKRIQYQTIDVTSLMKEGDNEITVELADGWYRGSVGAWSIRQEYGGETKFIAQLEYTLEDGSICRENTNGKWRWSNDGPVRFTDNKDGEIVDARLTPSYSGWAKLTEYDVVPTASDNVPVVEKETFKPTLVVTPSGNKVLDFGQNFAGYVSMKLNASEGQTVTMRFGELIDKNGEFTQTNIQMKPGENVTPLQRVDYICREGENNYKTKFAIFGFRYVLVDTEVEFSPEDFTGIAVYSDIRRTGFFDSSNTLLNNFVEATVWSTKSNSADLPTDCPTRERHGWTGDAQIFYNTASYLFDYAAFGRKYVVDMYDWQRKNGCLPHIVPDGGADFYMQTMNGSVGWADAGVLIPYRMWKKYGDGRIIADYYDRMKKYAQFMMKRCGSPSLLAKPLRVKDGKYLVNKGQSYGEWAEPNDVHPFALKEFITVHPEESTAYTVYIMEIMSEIASYLGKEADAKLYSQYAAGCRKAYSELLELPGFSLDTDRQAKLVRPLYFGLLDEKTSQFAKERLIKAMENYSWRLGTGFLSTPFILDVLADIDIEYAYRLLENEEMPGWLFMTKNGATTVWEGWEGPGSEQGISSLNHYSKGAVCEWLFKSMCGINMAGDRHFVIAPREGGSFTHATASYDSIYGTVSSGWVRQADKTVYTVSIPVNTTAEVVLPDGTSREITAGEYTFERGTI